VNQCQIGDLVTTPATLSYSFASLVPPTVSAVARDMSLRAGAAFPRWQGHAAHYPNPRIASHHPWRCRSIPRGWRRRGLAAGAVGTTSRALDRHRVDRGQRQKRPGKAGAMTCILYTEQDFAAEASAGRKSRRCLTLDGVGKTTFAAAAKRSPARSQRVFGAVQWPRRSDRAEVAHGALIISSGVDLGTFLANPGEMLWPRRP